MPPQINHRWLVQQRAGATVSESNFRWSEEAVPSPREGELLARNLWFSFDPTQRFLLGRSGPDGGDSSGAIPIGQPMTGLAVSEVIESRLPGFREGDVIYGGMGWEDYSVTDGTGFIPTYKVPEGIPLNWAAGCLGITGLAAYFGVTEVARPKSGESFVITGAAGGVGTIALQLAKLRGLKAIGITGSRAKCDWIVKELGADGAIDRRTENVAERLSQLCPEGIDVFFDNDYGPTLDLALERLRQGGRVVLCGGSARYGATEPPAALANLLSLVMVNGRMEGLLARDYVPRLPEAAGAMLPLLRSGRLKAPEDVAVGLRQAPRTLARLYAGDNFGKQLLRMDAASVP